MNRIPFSHLGRPCPLQPERGVAGDSQSVGPGLPHTAVSGQPFSCGLARFMCAISSCSQADLTKQQGLRRSEDCPQQRLHQSWSPWPTAVHGSSSCVLSCNVKGTFHQETHPHGAGSDPHRSGQGINTRRINGGVTCSSPHPGCEPASGRLQHQTLQQSFKLGRSLQSGPKAPFARGLPGSSAHICVSNEKLHH